MKIVEYKNFGKCLEISGGAKDEFRALVTVDIGPRIIYYGFKDGRNVFFEDEERKISTSGEYFDKNFRAGEKWYIYGGHRLWLAPESEMTYVPDNYPVEYELDLEKNGAIFRQPLQSNTKLRFSMCVYMDNSGTLAVRHIIENKGGYTAKASIWAISVMQGGGVEIIPLNINDTGFLPNNYFSLWSYNDLNDPRLKAVDGYLLLRQDSEIKRPFKLGLLNKTGMAAYKNQGILFTKKFPFVNGAVYPDNNCNYETYTSELMLEMESLSPIYEVEPGQMVEWTENMALIDLGDARDIELTKKKIDEMFRGANL